MVLNKKLIAVITGGEQGLGDSLVKLLLNDYDVFSLDIIQGANNRGKTFIKTNITSDAQVKNAFKKISEHGKIDLLINNAAIMRRGDTFGSSSEDFDSLFSVNVKGSWLVTKHCLPLLNKNGVVVFVSSRHCSLPSNPGLYGLTKYTLNGLSSLLDKDPIVKKNKVSVKTAILGPFETNLSKTGYSSENYKSRKMDSKEFVAKKVFELIKSKKNVLGFDKNYFFE